MADPEHLEILKQGLKVWNKWRIDEDSVPPDLCGVKLRGADLLFANFSFTSLKRADLLSAYLNEANLRKADLCSANLRDADLRGANLYGAYLKGADLRGAHCGGANFRSTCLIDADLRGADFGNADLGDAELSNVDLTGADLGFAYLDGAHLRGTNFTDVQLGHTTFARNDLSQVKGLSTVEHQGPSSISFDTINQSGGKLPEAFLRGCGLSDLQIEQAKLYNPELSNEEINNILYRIHDLRAGQALQISPLFISYSHADAPFVDAMEAHLSAKGVRFWRDVHHSTAGRLETQIDRAIRLNPTVLLVLSEHSVKSDWVEHEARLARRLELETSRDVLCPVALDDRWKTCRWPERLREQIMEYNILDFSAWRDEDQFLRMFGRLLDGLDLFYK